MDILNEFSTAIYRRYAVKICIFIEVCMLLVGYSYSHFESKHVIYKSAKCAAVPNISALSQHNPITSLYCCICSIRILINGELVGSWFSCSVSLLLQSLEDMYCKKVLQLYCCPQRLWLTYYTTNNSLQIFFRMLSSSTTHALIFAPIYCLRVVMGLVS